MPICFTSYIHEIASFRNDWDQDTIKNEPMLFNSSLDYAWEVGGPITRDFISNLPPEWTECNTVVDSRVHMLMPGWFPCIPGFHHDDIIRTYPNGQPNYSRPEYFSKHVMGLVNGDICPTQFALGDITLPNVPKGKLVYKEWHPIVQLSIDSGDLKSYSCPSGKIILFDWQSFHQGTRAIKAGWRWFIRISKNTHRTRNITNEIRRQVQVYLEHPMEGW